MNIEGKKVLVLGGYGLVGMAVCRELLDRKPREIQVHSLRQEESEEAQRQLLHFADDTQITISSGDIFGPVDNETSDLDRLGQQLGQLRDEDLPSFLLYHLLAEGRP